MALETQELRTEQASQLRLLAQSPGWALYRSRVLRLVERSEAAKASQLREAQDARLQQGVTDGLQQALRELDSARKELEREGEMPPSLMY